MFVSREFVPLTIVSVEGKPKRLFSWLFGLKVSGEVGVWTMAGFLASGAVKGA